MAKQFLDITGLTYVVNELKKYYAQNGASTAGRVNYANNALSAGLADALAVQHTFAVSSTDSVVTSSVENFKGIQDVTISVTIADAASASGTTAGGDYVAAKHGLLSAADKNKLDGIEAGAQVNVIESVSVTVASTTDVTTPSSTTANKAVTITLPQYALKTDVAAGINFKGLVLGVQRPGDDDDQTHKYLSDLTATAEAGDVYIVKDVLDDKKNVEYIFVPASIYGGSAHWEELGNTVALSEYYTKVELSSGSTIMASWISDWSTTTAKVKNAGKADQLATAQVINFTGDVNDTSISFDGSSSVTATLTIENGAISNAHIASDAAIAQSKIDGLTDDLASKVDRITSTTAAVNKIAYFSTSTGDINYGTIDAVNGSVVSGNNGIVSGGDVADAIDDAISTLSTSFNNAINALDYDTTQFPAGYYVTGVTQTDGQIAITREAKGAAAASGSLDGVTALVDGDTIDSALTGDYYITAISTADLGGLFSA